MADKQQQYRGLKEKMPQLLEGELGYCTDTEELYIGGADGNVLVGCGAWANAIAGKLTAVKAEAVTALEEEAELSDVVAAVNDLLAKLKAAGVMTK